MNGLLHETRLLVRTPAAAMAVALLLVLASLAVWCGTREVARQRHTIERLDELQRHDLAAKAARHARGDAGAAAYDTFHGTWDPPTPTAFLALGLRDAAPYVLRVRALALQAQLHEGESFNPELALAGRFDFAFVLVYLSPLILIALLHDLVASERNAGRLQMLLALPHGARAVWLRRAGLRACLVFAALALPVLGGALVNQTPRVALAAVLVVVAAHVAFWTGACLVVAFRGRSTVANATALVGAWAVLTLVLPVLGQAALTRWVPVSQGVDLMLAQRQAVHGAWDVPPQTTMQQFFRTHPQWRHTGPLPDRFHWKWYYAFQQLGDESVAAQVAAYRDGLLARQRWTARLGGWLPGVGAQTVLHRTAHTDLEAQIAYQDDVARFHDRLRSFYYPYFFDDRPFGVEDFAAQPRFDPLPRRVDVPLGPLAVLAAVSLVVLLAGLHAGRRVTPVLRRRS